MTRAMESESTPATSDRPSLLAVCTAAPWPVLNGYSLRVSHLLEELARHWSITLIAPASATVPRSVADHVTVALHGRGLTYPWRFDQTELRAVLDRVVRDLHPERALVWAGAEALWFGQQNLPPAVVDVIDCNPLEFWRGFMRYSSLRERYRSLRELPVAAWFARRTVQSFAATVCVGEADALWLRRVGGRDSVHVVPNGVAVPSPGSLAAEAATPVVSFTGALGYRPNIEAVLYAVNAIWPRIVAAVPGARFVIAGRHPVPEVLALGTRPGIDIMADVPDMVPVLGHSWVSVAPMRSGVGIKNKVLEAWACARPVVMTPLAANGLTVPADHASLVCGGADATADTVVRLFQDKDARYRLGLSAQEHVQRHFTWAGVASPLHVLLRNAAPDGLRVG